MQTVSRQSGYINVSDRGSNVPRIVQAVPCSTEEEEAERAQLDSAVRLEPTEEKVSGTQCDGCLMDFVPRGLCFFRKQENISSR